MPRKKLPAGKGAGSRAVAGPQPQGRPAAGEAGAPVFQLKITLDRTQPLIWRRLQTRDCSLALLHRLIQTGMGWHDDHLHVFRVRGEEYGDPAQWGDELGMAPDVSDEGEVTLGRLAAAGVKKFKYEYDMGDSWGHTVALERTVPAEAGAQYPRCTAGQRACPPEDCGGAWGYATLVAALQGEKSPRGQELLEWLGDDRFDPEAFDLEKVNERLRGLG